MCYIINSYDIKEFMGIQNKNIISSGFELSDLGFFVVKSIFYA